MGTHQPMPNPSARMGGWSYGASGKSSDYPPVAASILTVSGGQAH